MRAYVHANDSHMQYVCKSYKCTNKRIFKLRVAIANSMNGTKKKYKTNSVCDVINITLLNEFDEFTIYT